MFSVPLSSEQPDGTCGSNPDTRLPQPGKTEIKHQTLTNTKASERAQPKSNQTTRRRRREAKRIEGRGRRGGGKRQRQLLLLPILLLLKRWDDESLRRWEQGKEAGDSAEAMARAARRLGNAASTAGIVILAGAPQRLRRLLGIQLGGFRRTTSGRRKKKRRGRARRRRRRGHALRMEFTGSELWLGQFGPEKRRRGRRTRRGFGDRISGGSGAGACGLAIAAPAARGRVGSSLYSAA